MAESIPDENEAMSEEYHKHPETRTLYCDPCKDDGEQIPAAGFCVDCNDYLCMECYKHHKKARAYKTHVLKDKDEMPTSKPRTLPTKSTLERCKEHKQESIKWFCKSHDLLICDLCKQIDHRNCTEVKTITGMSQDNSSSAKVQHVKDRLLQLQKSSRENMSEITENIEVVERCYKAAIEEITKHLSEIRTRDIEVMKALELTCDTTITTVTSMLDELDTLAETGDKEEVFIATINAQSQLQSFQNRLTSVRDDNNITRYAYEHEALPGQSSDTNNVIGTIRVLRDEITPEKIDDISVKTFSDTNNCWITGIDILSDNKLVVADHNNAKIKVIDVTSKTVISEIKLDVAPRDVTRINDKRIAVTTYNNKKILIISITDTLTVQKTIDKSEFGYCYGITCSNDTLAMSYYHPNQIQILDLEGTVKQTIDGKDKDGAVRFGNVLYLTHSPNTNTLYLSDHTNHKVLSMTLDGEILASFTHEQLKNPRDIIVSKDGRIFVCSTGTNKIYEISSDLSKGQIIFDEKDGISSPWSIMYNDREHKLFVGSRNNTNVIQVFLV